LDSSLFEAKYAGLSIENLKVALEDAKKKLRNEKNAAFRDRYDRGQFVLRTPKPEPGQAEPVVKITPRPNDQYSMMRLSPRHPGATAIVWLPFEEYPELYDHGDEMSWLISKVGSIDPSAAMVK
jgi:hypothetical protein